MMMAMADSIGSLAWVQPSESHRPDNKCLQTKLVSANSTTVCVQTQMSPTNAVFVNCTVWTRQDCSVQCLVYLEYSKRFTVLQWNVYWLKCALYRVNRARHQCTVSSVHCALCSVQCRGGETADSCCCCRLQTQTSDCTSDVQSALKSALSNFRQPPHHSHHHQHNQYLPPPPITPWSGIAIFCFHGNLNNVKACG